ncbi:hypothetical protein TDB9533_01714 [Thalassocella blandensis]|nr:hypothetical protein TDB9533_01714 [Thalassocella blandensis]
MSEVQQTDKHEHDTDRPHAHKIPIGISTCLLGERVRFDSGHKHNSYITKTLGQYFAFQAFCPEVAIGLGIPREPIRLVSDKHPDEGGVIRCVGTKNKTLDVTEALKNIAQEQAHWHKDLCGYILKKDSPSCGMERVKAYVNEHPTRAGTGLYAQVMMQNFPNLPVEEEGRLGDARLRENFVKRVFAYHRWVQEHKTGLSWNKLYQFHAQHKLILMSHDQNLARDLGRRLSQAATVENKELDAFQEEYFSDFMRILKKIATRKNHVNVLQHLQGYLKKKIAPQDKQELCDTIDQYAKGLLPLIVPITLLRHYFRVHPDSYVENSYYLSAHPSELALLNNI